MFKRRYFVALFSIFLSFPSYSQIEINNQKSENHQLVPGTEVFMVPPPNFLALGFPGFVFPAADASMLVSKIPEANFLEIESELAGIIGDQKLISEVEDVRINGFQGKIFTTEEIKEGDPITYHTLFFGDNDFVYLVMGMCPSDHPGIIESIKESIFSIVYDPNAIESSIIPFSVQVEGTKMKEAGERSGMIFYTVDGKLPTESTDKTALILGSSIYPVDVEDAREYTVNRIKQLPYTATNVEKSQLREVQINGLSGFEFDFLGTKGSGQAEELVYVVMLFKDDKYYLIIGNASQDFEENLKLFKKVSSTFRLME